MELNSTQEAALTAAVNQDEEIHALTHDGVEKHRGTYNECWMHLLEMQSASTHRAIKYEGWAITQVTEKK